ALEMSSKQSAQFVFDVDLYPTIEEKAAILMINIATKHCFYNANKRTAVMATDLFLQLNGYDFQLDTQEGVDLLVFIATYRSDFDQLKNDVSKVIRAKLNHTSSH
ncbi:type II toxin-antitoxin system death-on-curing family toxin, partial [Enterococcus faecalis]|uniref:type II toxin-antitoxin system death-on-curing family toxin n=1 Tax=Enterococcus faecalis TaxID=1351 RepID=UPI003D6C5CAB